MKDRRHGPETVDDMPFRKLASKNLVCFPETLQKIVLVRRRVNVGYGLKNRFLFGTSTNSRSNYVPGREQPSPQAFPHPKAPIIPQIAQFETLIRLDFEDFIEPKMAPAHAVQEIAFACAQPFPFSFKEEIEHCPAIVKIKIENEPAMISEIGLLGIHYPLQFFIRLFR